MTDKDEGTIEEFDELPFDTGDPEMIMTTEEALKITADLSKCVDCLDTGVIGGIVADQLQQNFCNCIEGDILQMLAFGTHVELKFTLLECPVCPSQRARGRKYDSGKRFIYCPDCKQETERKL